MRTIRGLQSFAYSGVLLQTEVLRVGRRKTLRSLLIVVCRIEDKIAPVVRPVQRAAAALGSAAGQGRDLIRRARALLPALRQKDKGL